MRRYRQKHRPQLRLYMQAYHRLWYAKNRVKKQAQNQRWELQNRESRVPYLRQAALRWYYRNHRTALARIRRYYTNNKRRKNAARNRLLHAQRQRDPGFRLRCYFRSRLATLVRARGSKCFSSSRDVLTYSAEELRQHLESMFTRGMSWENYGKRWEVDHIVPVTEFELTRVEEARACFALANLRPLPVAENRRRFFRDRRAARAASADATWKRRSPAWAEGGSWVAHT